MSIVAIPSRPTRKHQEMTPEEFLAAIPKLLDGTFCSARWMLDSFDVVRKGRGGKRGQEPFGGIFRGRPRGRSVLCRPSFSAICCTQPPCPN